MMSGNINFPTNTTVRQNTIYRQILWTSTLSVWTNLVYVCVGRAVLMSGTMENKSLVQEFHIAENTQADDIDYVTVLMPAHTIEYECNIVNYTPLYIGVIVTYTPQYISVIVTNISLYISVTVTYTPQYISVTVAYTVTFTPLCISVTVAYTPL